MNKTEIPWCDYTWNPLVGCSPASTGCENCYAAAISKRFSLPWGSAHFMPQRLGEPGLLAGFHELRGHRRDKAIRSRTEKGWPESELESPWKIFVCSMADLGHETVKISWREAVCAVMEAAPWHQYIVLTKRPDSWILKLPLGVWCGVTVEAQREDWRMVDLEFWHVGTTFVSVEPMLGPVSLTDLACPVSWVIAGPETGPKARPCKDEWMDALAAESPCFFDKRANGRRREFPSVEGRRT